MQSTWITYVPVFFEHKDYPVPSLRKLHEKDRDKGLDMIAVSVNDRLNRLRSWAGKKIRLVECSRQLSFPCDVMFSSFTSDHHHDGHEKG